jgi:hypothetical protein
MFVMIALRLVGHGVVGFLEVVRPPAPKSDAPAAPPATKEA